MPQTALRPTNIAVRDAERLTLIHPPHAAVIREILRMMEIIGWPMTITAGVRTADEQFKLFQQGRRLGAITEPGAFQVGDKGIWVPIDPVRRTGIVTNADGFIKPSNHQPKADGRGRAVDCVFLIDGPDRDGELETPTWAADQPWHVYGTMGEHLGRGKIRWLGRGPTLVDMPHLEWID